MAKATSALNHPQSGIGQIEFASCGVDRFVGGLKAFSNRPVKRRDN